MNVLRRIAGFCIVVGLIGLIGPSFGLTIRGIQDLDTARIVGGVLLGIGILCLVLPMLANRKRS